MTSGANQRAVALFRPPGWRRWRVPAALLALVAVGLGFCGAALALQPIVVAPELDRLEVTMLGEIYDGRGDSLQMETAPGADGISGRMSVRATTPGTNPSWMVFALRNSTDKQIERWVTAERYSVIGSGVVWPDLDSRRIEALTPSLGFVPERVKSDRADIFKVTLEPGQTITYVAELSSDRFARVYLWKPLDYELKARDRQLFNGINLGLVGLLAIFLTAVFAANHKIIFPATALVAWCVLAYLCVDFGFWHKLFQLRPEENAVSRAATEAAIAASLVMFLYAFLRLGFWHGIVRVLAGAWIVGQLALVAMAVVDPRLASTFARVSFLVIGIVGFCFTLFLALRGQDRALALVPTWLLFLVWVFGAGVVVTGRLSGDVVVSGLVAGLVLIVILLGFTVTQFAFRALEPLYGASPSDLQLRSLAVDGAGAAIWEWNTRRDEFKVSSHVEAALGLSAGVLSTTVDDFVRHMHSADRERFRLTLWSVQERNGGTIAIDFRMRHADNTYRWFEIEAASLQATDRGPLRCVGLMRDVTDSKRAHERLLHDAVYDSLTGLPNRELLLDRLSVACLHAADGQHVRPTVIFIDVDKFKGVNTALGMIAGDSLLLTIARRLERHIGPFDTLARIGGDQFAIVIATEQDPRELAALAERIRRSLRSPIKISAQDIVLTGSLGIAVWEGQGKRPNDLLKDAEIAMYRAKRGGSDRIEIFRPEMTGDRNEQAAIEADLIRALEKGHVRMLFQPIIYLSTEELAGFEGVLRWEHPKFGVTNPMTLAEIDDNSEVIAKLGTYALSRAIQEVARWQKELPRPDQPLFVSVAVSSRQLFRQNLMQEVRHIFGRALVPKGALKLEVNESLLMENPEQAAEILEWLRGAGAELSLNDFGTGYSSVAYLQRFAFDTVKLDRGLVQNASPDGAGSAMVRSIVALAHELGKKIVADGVETAQDVAFLRSIGCEYAQGDYYSEPMGDREVLQLLRTVRKSERKLHRRGFRRARMKESRIRRRERARPDAPLEQIADRTNVADNSRKRTSGANGKQPEGRQRSTAKSQQRDEGSRVRRRNEPLEFASRVPSERGSANTGAQGPHTLPPGLPQHAMGFAQHGDHRGGTAPPSAFGDNGNMPASDRGYAMHNGGGPALVPTVAVHGGQGQAFPPPAAAAPLPPFSSALPAAPPPGQASPAPTTQSALPELKTLPPAIAASLARLAGIPAGSNAPAAESDPQGRPHPPAGEER